MENNLQGRVFPDHTAIGNKDGKTVLMRSRFIGGHRVLPESGRPKSRELVTVPCYTLDSWVKRLSIELDGVTFVKIDTQGWEIHILSRATNLLEQRHIAWQLEIDPKHLESAGAPLTCLFEILHRHRTHFIDLNSAAPGPRSRPVSELSSALAYVGDTRGRKTDILVYHAPRLTIHNLRTEHRPPLFGCFYVNRLHFAVSKRLRFLDEAIQNHLAASWDGWSGDYWPVSTKGEREVL